MQQATSPIAQTPPSGNIFAPPPASPRFVVNLCSSTTPVALVQPNHAGLKRFTFFVSRRLEEGRERFRLHMGYFDSQEEAEKMLDLVRDVYPAAWAGVAPGIKLRARAAQAAREAARHGEQAATVPVAEIRTAAAETPVVVATSPAVLDGAAAPATTNAAAPPVAPPSLRLELVPDLPRAQPAQELGANSRVEDATRSLDDVRAAIESLADTGPHANGALLEGEAVLQLLTSARPNPAARVIPMPPLEAPPPPERVAASPATGKPSAPAGKAANESSQAAAKAQPAARAEPARVEPARLEPTERSEPEARVAPSPRVATATRAGPAARTEPTLFAVQLLWSVQPIDMGQVPLLAIFSAYTLYGAEGNRDGRRWYGLRLGFFTDAVSAKQVAQYVRSEFSSVSVVPVSERERGRANAATAKPMPQQAQQLEAGPELNFIDDTSGSMPALPEPPTVNARAVDSPAAQAAMAAVGMNARPTPGKRVKPRATPAPKPATKRPRPLSLEETLEILGAGDLSLEKSRGELMNDNSRRERKQATPSSSKFGRLINRLAERLGNG